MDKSRSTPEQLEVFKAALKLNPHIIEGIATGRLIGALKGLKRACKAIYAMAQEDCNVWYNR